LAPEVRGAARGTGDGIRADGREGTRGKTRDRPRLG